MRNYINAILIIVILSGVVYAESLEIRCLPEPCDIQMNVIVADGGEVIPPVVPPVIPPVDPPVSDTSPNCTEGVRIVDNQETVWTVESDLSIIRDGVKQPGATTKLFWSNDKIHHVGSTGRWYRWDETTNRWNFVGNDKPQCP